MMYGQCWIWDIQRFKAKLTCMIYQAFWIYIVTIRWVVIGGMECISMSTAASPMNFGYGKLRLFMMLTNSSMGFVKRVFHFFSSATLETVWPKYTVHKHPPYTAHWLIFTISHLTWYSVCSQYCNVGNCTIKPKLRFTICKYSIAISAYNVIRVFKFSDMFTMWSYRHYSGVTTAPQCGGPKMVGGPEVGANKKKLPSCIMHASQ